MINYVLSGKFMIICLIAGLIKKTVWKWVIILLNHTFNLAARLGLASLKVTVDKIDIDKIK